MKIHLPLPLRALIVPIGISACLQTNRVYAAAQPPSDVPLVGFKNPASYPVLTSLVFTSYGSGTESPAATRISLSGTSFLLRALRTKVYSMSSSVRRIQPPTADRQFSWITDPA